MVRAMTNQILKKTHLYIAIDHTNTQSMTITKYFFVEKFEVYPNKYIDGFEEVSDRIEYYSYKHVTLELCKDVCEQLKTEECCSMLYWEVSAYVYYLSHLLYTTLF